MGRNILVVEDDRNIVKKYFTLHRIIRQLRRL